MIAVATLNTLYFIWYKYKFVVDVFCHKYKLFVNVVCYKLKQYIGLVFASHKILDFFVTYVNCAFLIYTNYLK